MLSVAAWMCRKHAFRASCDKSQVHSCGDTVVGRPRHRAAQAGPADTHAEKWQRSLPARDEPYTEPLNIAASYMLPP